MLAGFALMIHPGRAHRRYLTVHDGKIVRGRGGSALTHGVIEPA